MTKNQPLPPLKVGNVVSVAVTLYRSHLKDYLGIALRATLWQALPVFSLALITGFGTSAGNGDGRGEMGALLSFAILGGFIGAIVLWFIGFSRYLVNAALISRLAFKELINQPERIKPAREAILPYKWSFLSISIRIGFSLLLIYFGLIILLFITLFIAGLVLSLLGRDSMIAGVIIVLLGIAAIIGSVFILIWFFSRWFIAELPLAIEDNINSMQRSWELTKNVVLRIQGIAIIAFLITLPLIGITSYLPQIFLITLPQGSFIYWLVYVISLLSGLLGNIFVLPLWQTIKAVLYYDLRNRKEGLNMILEQP